MQSIPRKYVDPVCNSTRIISATIFKGPLSPQPKIKKYKKNTDGRKKPAPAIYACMP
jgi:hypothetical protein